MEKAPNQHPEISMKRYRQYKLKLKSLERANRNAIMMIPCSGSKNWHEMAERSALIYYYEVCKKLKRKVKFFADTMSLYDQYEIGYIRSLGVDTIRENLKKVGLYKSELKEEDLVVFQLNTEYSKEAIQKLQETEMSRRQKNLAPESTGLLNPTLHQILVRSSNRLHGLCMRRLDKLSSQTNGADIVRLVDGMLENYHQAAMLPTKLKPRIIEKYSEMRKTVYILIIKIRLLGEVGLWDFDMCSSVTELFMQARDLIEQELAKLLKDNVKNSGETGQARSENKQAQPEDKKAQKERKEVQNGTSESK